jgi:hypothetical protein
VCPIGIAVARRYDDAAVWQRVFAECAIKYELIKGGLHHTWRSVQLVEKKDAGSLGG